jgi:alpha-glucosidase
MKKIIPYIISVAACIALACNDSQTLSLTSPDGKISVAFILNDGKPFYSVAQNGKTLIEPSRLGVRLTDSVALCCNFKIVGTATDAKDEIWQQVWGEEIDARNHYNELAVTLAQDTRQFVVRFRAFDDGVGFRYEYPEQPDLREFKIADELTEFALAADDSIWTQHLFDRDYEQLYRKSLISAITDTVSTPVTVETADGRYLAIHEAALVDYAKMNLCMTAEARRGATLRATLTPWNDGVKVYARTPFVSPWRTVIVADNLNALVNSRLMLNLNEPCQIADTRWIKPAKYVGIWWGMHLEKWHWALELATPQRTHGATTENMKHYIDFAAKHHFDGVLVEGWNRGWDGYMRGDGTTFSFSQPYPDFDIAEVSRYAAQKGVAMIGHNETAGAVGNYEAQLDSAFAFAQKYGIPSIKTGYVNALLDDRERHSSQYGVRHYRKVVETAARYQLTIDMHEPIMPTGWQRTYPNLLAQEGARGQEWDAWDAAGGNPPEHTTILPFTRALAGPVDFTPGTFNFANPVNPQTRVQTTIAKQLALYVVIYSPLQMASDLIEHYAARPEFEFIELVPVDWQKTLVIDGKIGDFVVTARKDKHSDDWYLGAITDENARELTVALSFLDKGKKYRAKIFRDAADADWQTRPYAIDIVEQQVDANAVMNLHLAPGGGAAIRFKAQ